MYNNFKYLGLLAAFFANSELARANVVYIPKFPCPTTKPTAGNLDQYFNNCKTSSSIPICPTAGDTVYVCPGTYTDTNKDGSVVILRKSGTEGSYLTILPASNAAKPVLDGQDSASIGFDIADTTSYIKISGFEVKNMKRLGFSIVDWDGSTSTTSSNITIINNYIHDIGNTNANTSGFSNSWGRAGIYAGDGAYKITIDGNYFERIGDSRGNRSTCSTKGTNCLDHGVYIGSSDDVNIINNIFDWSTVSGYKNNPGFPLHIYQSDEPKNDIKIYHNTFRGTGASYTDGGAVMLGVTDGSNDTLSNVSIKYNIFYTPFYTGKYYKTFYAINNESCDGTRTNINIMYNVTNAQFIGVDSVSSNSTTLCNLFPSPTNNTVNLTDIGTLFVYPTGKNYHLKSTTAPSPVINKIPSTEGDPVVNDMDGGTPARPCGSGKDIGADEYCL